MLTKKNISKKYHFNKKIALEQQCSVLLHYWLALKLNWTKRQHTILQLDKIFFRKYFLNLIYRILSIKTLSTWELWLFLWQRKSRKTTPNKSMIICTRQLGSLRSGIICGLGLFVVLYSGLVWRKRHILNIIIKYKGCISLIW